MNSMRPALRLPALLGLACAAALAAGCGSESSNSKIANPGTSTAETTTAAKAEAGSGSGQKIDVSSPASGALQFEPNDLTAKAGDVTIVYKNPSPVPHNVAILGADGKPTGTEMKIFANGEGETTAKLTAGTYKFICEVPGHEQGGMVGQLKVS